MCCIKDCCSIKEAPKVEPEAKQKALASYPPITQKTVGVASKHMRGHSVVLRYKEGTI
jgi:hypothetical protein